ncbi:MAG TPA: hypothetical protein VGN78_06445, partial [Solirubrobacteraceae bacterium]|nr:hypothetical protein [Solirubrobacteraceae bacterium]
MNAQPDTAALLRRFAPCLRYDSLEGYFADSAEEWTANPGNRLQRADGTVVATAGEQLTLRFLDDGRYTSGDEVQPGDLIEAASDDYSRQYAALRGARPELRNVIYGRSVAS